jgi:hypothetical protein
MWADDGRGLTPSRLIADDCLMRRRRSGQDLAAQPA